MSREAQAAVHLRRFANAVSIAIAVPQDRKSGVRTLRELLAGIAQTVGSDPTYSASALLSSEAIADPLNKSVQAAQLPPDQAPQTEVSTSAVPKPTVDTVSIDSSKARDAATGYFNQLPWDGQAPVVAATESPPAVSAIAPRSALASMPEAAVNATANSFFGGIAWEQDEQASVQPVAVAAPIVRNEGSSIAPAMPKETVTAPSIGDSSASSASGFFGTMNWEASQVTTIERKASTPIAAPRAEEEKPASASGFFGGVNWEAESASKTTNAISIQPSPGAEKLAQQFNALPGATISDTEKKSAAPSNAGDAQPSSDFFKRMPWDSAGATESATTSQKKES